MLCQLSYTHHPKSLERNNLAPDMARLEGIEPPTYGLEIRCSIRLSYRRMADQGPLTRSPVRMRSVGEWSPAKAGRGERIRTSDFLLPKQARYRAAPRPEYSVANRQGR